MSEGSIVFWDVVEEHLDDAEFLWTQWERCLASPAYTLVEVAERDEERLLANVDGLVSGGLAVREKVIVPALESDAPGRRAAAAFALLSSGDRAAADPLLRLLREGDPPLRASATRALGLSTAPWIDDALRALLHDGAPAAQAAALSALAFRRASPGAALSGIRGGDDPALLIAAFESAAVWHEKVPTTLVIAGLSSPEPAVRDAAIAAGLALGLGEAWTACQKLVRHAGPESFATAESVHGGPAGGPTPRAPVEPLPMLFAATLGDARELEPFLNAAGAPLLRRGAAWALGYGGRASSAEACLALVDDPEVGKLAGEAFATITGLPVDGSYLAPEAADRDEPVPLAEEDLGASLVPTAEDALPRLDRAAVEAWWQKQRSRFERGRRYLFGVPWGRESLLAALARGPMRRRGGLAAEVAVRTRGRVQVQTRALTARQRAEVAAASGIAAGELERPFE